MDEHRKVPEFTKTPGFIPGVLLFQETKLQKTIAMLARFQVWQEMENYIEGLWLFQ